MAEKSAKRLALEVSLAADPGDPFLRYGLAVQCLRDGATEEGRSRLRQLLADQPDEVAAYQQLGQSYAEADEFAEAATVLTEGIQRARARGEWHAAEEMGGLLDQIRS